MRMPRIVAMVSLLATVAFHVVIAVSVTAGSGCAASSAPAATQIHPAAARSAPGGPVFDGDLWAIGESTGSLRYPLQADVGETITEWIVFLQRDQLGPRTTARLQCLETVSATHIDMSPAATDGTSGPGYVALHMPPCPVEQPPPPQSPQPCMSHVPVGEDCTYALLVAGDGVAGDRAGAVTVYMTRQ